MAFQPSVLLVTDAVALPAAAVLWALGAFQEKAAGGRRLAVVTRASQIVGDLKLELSSLDAVVCWAENSGFLSVPWLVDLSKLLKPGASLVVRQPETLDIQAKTTLERDLLLAGYINSQPLGEVESFTQDVVIKAQKPTWEIGSSFAIKKATMKQGPSTKINGATFKLSTQEINDIAMDGNSSAPSNGSGAFKLPAFEADIDNDFVDEDSLLTEEDLKRPALPLDDDCDVGKAGRKACKNCTCGRAALEEKDRKGPTPEQLNNPQSACGNCGLGDAFRCGGCPYRGLPPFKLGEKIVLPGTLVTADV